ncbi:MAG: type II toxin-antitoxin system VapB family antitoxin [Akkermansiaceae bacterium]
MRATFSIDTALYEKAGELTGISDTDELIREAITALIARESGKQLAKLGGTAPNLEIPPRRRTTPSS